MLILAAALFAVFFANVAVGAATGTPFLNDISEMLLLLASSISFVAAILIREQREKTHHSE